MSCYFRYVHVRSRLIMLSKVKSGKFRFGHFMSGYVRLVQLIPSLFRLLN
jgi:hypothetical protein